MSKEKDLQIEKFENPTNIFSEENLDVNENTVVVGFVSGWGKLNVREKPSVKSKVVCVIDVETEVIIDEQESTGEFYKVCTATGVEGFCMKKFIAVEN